MPRLVGRDRVQKLLKDEKAQLVEVLPARQYEDIHIAGAINLPLQELDGESAAVLQKDRPVIVYCYDYQ